MIRPMKGLGIGASRVAVALCVAAAACGGGAKGADSPGTCPDATVLKGSDCVPASAGPDPTGGDAPPPKAPKADTDQPAPGAAPASDAPSAGGPPYDKDAVEIELKRATRQVKANCGSATDDDGAATGPWGTTTASVTLGRNGHVKQVTVPAPYDGKAVGVCIVHAFQKIQFPPYGGSVDVAVDREVELKKPKH
jgi:hypothetical protein